MQTRASIGMPVSAAALLVSCFASAAAAVDVAQLMSDFGLSPEAAARVRRGEMVESDPAPASERELAVGLTYLVVQPIENVLDAFRSAADMKADPQLQASDRLRESPEDIRDLSLSAEESRRYLAAGPGDVLNLSTEEIRRFRALSAAPSDPRTDVERELRSMIFDRYRAYLGDGLDAVAPYARSAGSRKPSDELRASSNAAALLKKFVPPLWQLLLSYPRGKPPGLDEAFYCLRYDLDGRPNYTLRHRLALAFDGGVALVDRDFYVSHGYNASQSVSGLVPVSEGTLVFYRSRVSTDQVGGLGSSMKRTIGRSVMAKQLTEIFERTRASYEPGRMSPVALGRAPQLLR